MTEAKKTYLMPNRPASQSASGIMIAAQSPETKGKLLVADLTVA